MDSPDNSRPTIEEMILNELDARSKSVKWLAEEIQVNDRHLRYILRGIGSEKRKLTDKIKESIEHVLEKKFNLSE